MTAHQEALAEQEEYARRWKEKQERAKLDAVRESDEVTFIRRERDRTRADVPFSAIAAKFNLSAEALRSKLEALRDAGKIRLTAWTGPPERIPHPELSFPSFSGRPLYYAHAV